MTAESSLSPKGLRVADLVKSGAGQGAAIERAPGVYESRGIGNSYLLTTPAGDVLVNAGALDLIEATVAAGAPAGEARSWWVSYLTQQANAREVPLEALPITPGAVARVIALVAAGELTNNLARQVVDGVLAGEGTPDEVVAARGLAIVSDEGALGDAVDRAIEANPDVAAKIRDGKVAAEHPDDPSVTGTRAMFDLVAREPRLDATAFQTVGTKGYDGLLVARVTD